MFSVSYVLVFIHIFVLRYFFFLRVISVPTGLIQFFHFLHILYFICCMSLIALLLVNNTYILAFLYQVTQFNFCQFLLVMFHFIFSQSLFKLLFIYITFIVSVILIRSLYFISSNLFYFLRSTLQRDF